MLYVLRIYSFNILSACIKYMSCGVWIQRRICTGDIASVDHSEKYHASKSIRHVRSRQSIRTLRLIDKNEAFVLFTGIYYHE